MSDLIYDLEEVALGPFFFFPLPFSQEQVSSEHLGDVALTDWGPAVGLGRRA